MSVTVGYGDGGGDAHGGPKGLRRWASQPAAWFAIAALGLVTVFVGLGIDAWRHENGAGEESLLSLSNPGHVVAAIGLIVVAVAVLSGLSVALLSGVESAESAIRRFVPVTAAWATVATVGIASVTYIGASGVTVGHSGHDDGSSVAAEGGGGEAGIAQALTEEGIGSDVDPNDVEGALTRGASGQPDGKHDHGQHPTFTQLQTMSDSQLIGLFPDGTVSDASLPALRDEVAQVRAVAEQLNTPEAAAAAGFRQTTNDVPFMGEHWLNFQYVQDGVFDPTKPEGLLFSTIDGERKLVGVWFLQIPGICPKDGGTCTTRAEEPAGFAGDLDLWHAHLGLCIVKLQGASEGETREGCEAKGGTFTADLRWMMHVWVTPETSENPDGFFAYLNGDLFEKQQASRKAADGEPSGTTGD